MKILITGANGFVGRHLVTCLEQDGHNLFGLDLQEDNSNKEQLAYYKCDIRDYASVHELIEKICPDQIYHLAGLSSVKSCEENPGLAIDVNVKGTLNLLHALKARKLFNTRLLVVSSAQVYGKFFYEMCPIKESEPVNPCNEYATTKACAEVFSKQFQSIYGLDVVIARPFNHFGPGQQLGFFFSDVCSQLAEIEQGAREPVISVGNISVARDFLDVRDVVCAYISYE